MLARQLAYITYVRGSVSTLQILLSPGFYGLLLPTLSREEPNPNSFLMKTFMRIVLNIYTLGKSRMIDYMKKSTRFVLLKKKY